MPLHMYATKDNLGEISKKVFKFRYKFWFLSYAIRTFTQLLILHIAKLFYTSNVINCVLKGAFVSESLTRSL